VEFLLGRLVVILGSTAHLQEMPLYGQAAGLSPVAQLAVLEEPEAQLPVLLVVEMEGLVGVLMGLAMAGLGALVATLPLVAMVVKMEALPPEAVQAAAAVVVLPHTRGVVLGYLV